MRPCRADQMDRGFADHCGQVALVIAAPPTVGSRTEAETGEGARPAGRECGDHGGRRRAA
jgi:hypothetical protein